MAQSDLDSMAIAKENEAPKTASEQLAGLGEDINDVNAAEAAAAAGVIRASFINYDVALDAYAARDDVEDLAHKNARDFPSDFSDASFMRTADGQAGSGSSL